MVVSPNGRVVVNREDVNIYDRSRQQSNPIDFNRSGDVTRNNRHRWSTPQRLSYAHRDIRQLSQVIPRRSQRKKTPLEKFTQQRPMPYHNTAPHRNCLSLRRNKVDFIKNMHLHFFSPSDYPIN